MIRRPPRSTQSRSSAASDVYKRQHDMIRPGPAAHRFLTISIAFLVAIAGIATVVAQALGPAGPSPASGTASVIAHAVVELPEGNAVWRIRNLPVDDMGT